MVLGNRPPTGTELLYYVPVYVYHDCNTVVSTAPSLNEVIQFENLKVKQVTKMFTYYRRMIRNIPINTSLTTQIAVNSRGYLPTNSPTATQTVVVFFPIFGDSSTAITFGTLITSKEAR